MFSLLLPQKEQTVSIRLWWQRAPLWFLFCGSHSDPGKELSWSHQLSQSVSEALCPTENTLSLLHAASDEFLSKPVRKQRGESYSGMHAFIFSHTGTICFNLLFRLSSAACIHSLFLSFGHYPELMTTGEQALLLVRWLVQVPVNQRAWFVSVLSCCSTKCTTVAHRFLSNVIIDLLTFYTQGPSPPKNRIEAWT